MSLFVFSIPFVIISIELIILPIIENILKFLGLVGLVKSLLGGLHDYSGGHIGYWEEKRYSYFVAKTLEKILREKGMDVVPIDVKGLSLIIYEST